MFQKIKKIKSKMNLCKGLSQTTDEMIMIFPQPPAQIYNCNRFSQLLPKSHVCGGEAEILGWFNVIHIFSLHWPCRVASCSQSTRVSQIFAKQVAKKDPDQF